jgi:hypothetical protein
MVLMWLAFYFDRFTYVRFSVSAMIMIQDGENLDPPQGSPINIILDKWRAK